MRLGEMLLQRFAPGVFCREVPQGVRRGSARSRELGLQLAHASRMGLFGHLQRFLALACLHPGAIDLCVGAIFHRSDVRGVGVPCGLGLPQEGIDAISEFLCGSGGPVQPGQGLIALLRQVCELLRC